MAKIPSLSKTMILFTTIFVIIALIGCGPSKEKQQMTSFIAEYGQAVDAYIELSKQADTNGIAEAKAKIESFKSTMVEHENGHCKRGHAPGLESTG